MNKKLLFTIIITFLLLSGCGKVNPSNVAQQNGQVPTVTASDSIDYDQYIKKTWFIKNGMDNDGIFSLYNEGTFNIYISKIVNGEITGDFAINGLIVADHDFFLDQSDKLGDLTGTINNGIAECNFNDKEGNKGELELNFKSKEEVEATIKFTDKSQNNLVKDGTFQLEPYNIKDINGFSPFADQCFDINLNSWGNIKFISGQVTGGKHVPTVIFLTDEDENILYDFDSPLPYYADIKAVSFEDLNKDGLKDIIIIATDDYQVPVDKGGPIAEVFFQKSDGSFTEDHKLNSEINTYGNNKDIQSVKDYLSKKF
jgi:major membrane immunogen (membrane-anchored lipoprotein)